MSMMHDSLFAQYIGMTYEIILTIENTLPQSYRCQFLLLVINSTGDKSKIRGQYISFLKIYSPHKKNKWMQENDVK